MTADSVSTNKCRLRITCDEFVYNHPATGFDGSFNATPDRTLLLDLSATGSGKYEGKLFVGGANLGSVTLQWASSYFRRANLEIDTLDGAVAPQSVPATSGSGNESFKTIFNDAGWQFSVKYNAGTAPLPAALSGVQDPNSCWTRETSHTLMQSLPNYDPTDLDSKWKAHLIAVPADMGCSRGRMFDNSTGDLNDVDREGAVTHSDDGYPAPNSDFGTAEGEMQRNVPRAYLRSAAHEVGHTFNQIHQSFESGNDNSVMTTTPSVASVLTAGGDDYIYAEESIDVWVVGYPTREPDNDVAHLLLHPSVGRIIASGGLRKDPEGIERIKQAKRRDDDSPACERIEKIIGKTNS